MKKLMLLLLVLIKTFCFVFFKAPTTLQIILFVYFFTHLLFHKSKIFMFYLCISST